MQESAREAAASRGENTYQGADCPRQHGGRRYTINAACCTCSAEAQAARRARLRKKIAAARSRAQP